MDVYHFHLSESVDLSQVDGDAIILIGKENCEQILFIRNKKILYSFLESDKIDRLIDSCSYGNHNVLRETNTYLKNNASEGILDIQSIKNNKYLRYFIKTVAQKYQFPYAMALICLSKDGKSIKIRLAEKNKPNMHPLLTAYQPSNNLLLFLRQLKTIPNLNLCVKFYQDGGIPMGFCSFGMTIGGSHKIGIDGMIDIVLQAKQNMYCSIFEKIKKITSRFLESPLTPKKKEILEDFKHYCVEKADNGIGRSELVENWANNYLEQHKVNPFDTLKLRRHTYTGLMSIFNPSKTDSILLFEKFLANEKISDSLNDMMQTNSRLLSTDQEQPLLN